MATAEALMTAEEFGQRPDPGYPEELVQGRIVSDADHPIDVMGKVCAQASDLSPGQFRRGARPRAL